MVLLLLPRDLADGSRAAAPFGEGHGDLEPFAVLTVRGDATVVEFRDGLCHGEADAVAFLLLAVGRVAPVEPFEEFVAVALFDAFRCVVAREVDPPAALFEGHVDGGAGHRVLDGIVREDGAELLERLFVPEERDVRSDVEDIAEALFLRHETEESVQDKAAEEGRSAVP